MSKNMTEVKRKVRLPDNMLAIEIEKVSGYEYRTLAFSRLIDKTRFKTDSRGRIEGLKVL